MVMTLFLRFGHPLLLIGTFALWIVLGASAAAFSLSWLALIGAVALLEQFVPNHPDERPTWARRGLLLFTGLVLSIGLGALGVLYEDILRPLFEPIATAGPGAIWPHGLHWLIQGMLLYLVSDGINYWMHRAFHQWSPLWRISGHGVHHAFHNLNVHHSILSHPFELFFLAAPMALAAAIFGVDSQVVLTAGLMITAVASLAHANIAFDTPVLRWVITQPVHHRLHHSLDPAERETNYACTAILWDHVFGTYDGRNAEATGLGPKPPTFREQIFRPFLR